ncbi:rifin PIR protein, putative [Plasmodium reichenowi]|uniref:Rifin PIR protein, putative n=1 Tax=Plasmodium reichenowi TaxID=5854 RepID=A0A2P9DHF1_PLARE|nr:rifin PIR protein, putative [Plasmodium reichenowi]
MKVHYINILLFALPLNILVHNQSNHNRTTSHHTPKIPTTRLLCECELYAPANYDNDQEMKNIMDNFNKQTQQRLHEYDERMKTTRQKCKDKCDKEIQKIILKDKLEKQLMDKFATLDTNVTTDDIPTCVCEKSIADKTEKFCLNCGKNMGAIAPWWGLVCGLGYAGWTHYVAGKVLEEGVKKGIEVGLTKAKEILTLSTFSKSPIPPITVADLMDAGNFTDGVTLHEVFKAFNNAIAGKFDKGRFATASSYVQHFSTNGVSSTHYNIEITAVKNAVNAAETAESTRLAAYNSMLNNTIISSVMAIVVIILVMLIIYLILRYRRKKKIKKKLQYIKLLEE